MQPYLTFRWSCRKREHDEGHISLQCMCVCVCVSVCVCVCVCVCEMRVFLCDWYACSTAHKKKRPPNAQLLCMHALMCTHFVQMHAHTQELQLCLVMITKPTSNPAWPKRMSPALKQENQHQSDETHVHRHYIHPSIHPSIHPLHPSIHASIIHTYIHAYVTLHTFQYIHT